MQYVLVSCEPITFASESTCTPPYSIAINYFPLSKDSDILQSRSLVSFRFFSFPKLPLVPRLLLSPKPDHHFAQAGSPITLRSLTLYFPLPISEGWRLSLSLLPWFSLTRPPTPALPLPLLATYASAPNTQRCDVYNGQETSAVPGARTGPPFWLPFLIGEGKTCVVRTTIDWV